MLWHASHRFDPRAAAVADRHYSRQSVGNPQFVRPSHNVVLLTEQADALWVSCWQPIIKHQWKHSWECALFRNESPHLASELIRQAVAATRWKWGDAPSDGMITFVNKTKVRHKRDPGRCYLKAGFKKIYEDEKMVVLQFLGDEMPPPEAPHGVALDLFGCDVDERVRSNIVNPKWQEPK